MSGSDGPGGARPDRDERRALLLAWRARDPAFRAPARASSSRASPKAGASAERNLFLDAHPNPTGAMTNGATSALANLSLRPGGEPHRVRLLHLRNSPNSRRDSRPAPLHPAPQRLPDTTPPRVSPDRPPAEAPLSPQWLGGFQKGPNANGAKAAADKVRLLPLSPSRDPVIDPLARLLPSSTSRSPSDPSQIRRSDEARSFVFRPPPFSRRSWPSPPRHLSTLHPHSRAFPRVLPRADRHAFRPRGRRHRRPLER